MTQRIAGSDGSSRRSARRRRRSSSDASTWRARIAVAVLSATLLLPAVVSAGAESSEPTDPSTTAPAAPTSVEGPATTTSGPPATEPSAATTTSTAAPTTSVTTAVSETTETTVDCTNPDPSADPDVACVALDEPLVPMALVVEDNLSGIQIPAAGSASQIGPASPYPSTITISGQSGAITSVSVQLFGLTHAIAGDVDIMLVSPDGKTLVVMSDIMNNFGVGFANANVTLSDAGSAPPTSGGTISGSPHWRPTDNDPAGGADPFPAPAPSTAPLGTTFATAFSSAQANGVWSLYIVDDATGDIGNISGGWSLTVDTAVDAVPTTTAVSSTPNPSLVGAPATFTASVRDGATPVTAGSVTFSEGVTTLAANIPVNASGQATLTTSTLTEGTHAITATYSGATGLLTSAGTTSHIVDAPTTTPATGQWCNTGPITGPPSSGPASPYPSRITVSGAGLSTTGVTVRLGSVAHAVPVDLDVLLVSPTGQNLMLMSDVGGIAPASGATLTFTDGAGAVPAAGPLVTGTYRPTDDDATSADGAFPAPAPSVSGATALATFNGQNPNGVWQLFVLDDASADAGAVSGGWCLDISTAAATTTTVTSSANPSVVGGSVTFTVTVTSGGAPVTSGQVRWIQNGVPLGIPIRLNANGQTTFNTIGLPVGTNTITASYLGTTNYQPSSASVSQTVVRIASTTTLTSSTNPAVVGAPVTFTATVTGGGGPITVGTVQFSDGGVPIGTPVPVNSSGRATLTTSALTAGTHTIGAAYAQTADVGASSDTLDQVVSPAGSATAVTSSANPSTLGQAVTFTATVIVDDGPNAGSAVTSGSVTFTDTTSGATLGTVTVDGLGQATLTTSTLTVGTHTIEAAFTPASTAIAGSDGSVDQVVEAVADAGGTYMMNEGDVLALNGTSSVAGPGATYSWDVNGDGTFGDATGVQPTLSWADLDALGIDGDDPAAPLTVTLRVTEGASFDDATTLTVYNTAPTATSLTDDGPVGEGSPATVTVTGATDVSTTDRDGLRFRFDFGDDGSVDVESTTPSVVVPGSLLANGPGTFDVSVVVVDPDGGASAPLTTTIDITNVAATAYINGPSTAVVGEPVTIKVGAEDPSPVDMAGTFQFTVDWGDGSTPVTLPGPADPPVTHTYTAAGTYTVIATVVDPDGAVSAPLEFPMTVVAQEVTTTTSSPTTTAPATSTSSPSTGASATSTGSSTIVAAADLAGTGPSRTTPIASISAIALAGVGAFFLRLARRPRGASSSTHR